jgi:molybdopterin/thiamine biosynthesis adenylyltransferase
MSAELLGQVRTHVERFRPREAAAVILVGRSRWGENEVLLARRAILLEPDAYQVQERYRLVLHPRVVNSVISLCEANHLGVVFCHSHPADIPYSESDDYGEARLHEVFGQFLPGLPFASLLLCPSLTMGRVWGPGREPRVLTDLRLLGPTIKSLRLDGNEGPSPQQMLPMYDRQARALGNVGQSALARTKVAIVGVGGTGSPTAEQLIRLGVRDLVLIDPDVIDETTITRGYGIFREHIRDKRRSLLERLSRKGRAPIPKVVAVASHLQRIDPECQVQAVERDVVETEVARMLMDRDVVFSCIDEHWGRAVLNQIAYQYLIPTINMGVRLDALDGAVTAAAGSVQVLRPGAACLWCGGSLSSDRIRSESLSSSERAKLEAEQYVVGLGSRSPSVVSFTTTLSSLAVTAFLQLITGFLGEAPTFARQNYFIREGLVRTAVTNVRETCSCNQVLGFGDLRPLNTVAARRHVTP